MALESNCVFYRLTAAHHRDRAAWLALCGSDARSRLPALELAVGTLETALRRGTDQISDIASARIAQVLSAWPMRVCNDMATSFSLQTLQLGSVRRSQRNASLAAAPSRALQLEIAMDHFDIQESEPSHRSVELCTASDVPAVQCIRTCGFYGYARLV